MRNAIPALSLALLLAACGQQASPAASQPAAAQPATQPSASQPTQPTGARGAVVPGPDGLYVSNELLVTYHDEAALTRALALSGGVLADRVPELRLALVRVPGDALKLATLLRHQQGVSEATPNYVTVSRPAPISLGTSSLGKQGNSADQFLDGPNSQPQYALDPRHLNAKAAWDLGFTGAGVRVAVVDDPADVTHPDLAATWSGLAYDPVTGTQYTDAQAWRTFANKPGIDHGTFVSSSILAAKDNQGIVGVAYAAKLLPVAIFQPAFVGDFAVAKGVVWAVANGARVINNSWGGGLSFGAIKAAFDYALGRGVVVVASMGNSYKDEKQYPAALPGVMASGAADASRRKATFSTSGRHISSSAPGQDTLLANPTWLGGGYQLISGTSFSSPYTAGVAALAVGKCPAATPYQVRRLLEQTADGSVGPNPNGFDRETGYGHLNAGAMAAALSSCDKLPARGANIKVQVSYYNGDSNNPGILANVILRGKGLQPGVTSDSTPLYEIPTDADGNAIFAEVAPGDYDIYVGGPDLSLTGDSAADRGSFVGTLTATSGSTQAAPDFQQVVLLGKSPDLNPVDPYEPNDVPADAKALAVSASTTVQPTATAYIYGKPRDLDYFRVTVAAGDRVQFNMDAATALGGTLDGYLTLYGPDGTTVLSANDDTNGQDPQITYTFAAAGTYYVRATSYTIAQSAGQDDDPFNKYQLRAVKTN